MMVTSAPPRKFQRVIERVVAKDREYFAKHPEATQYVRDYVPGEAWPQHPHPRSKVTVVKHSAAYQFRLITEPKAGDA